MEEGKIKEVIEWLKNRIETFDEDYGDIGLQRRLIQIYEVIQGLENKVKQCENTIDKMAEDLVNYYEKIEEEYSDSLTWTVPKNVEEVKEWYKEE